MRTPNELNEFERIARKALACRECFNQPKVEEPPFNIAQPRWVGQHYWDDARRLTILMINPGQGPAEEETLALYRDVRDGRRGIDEVLKHEHDSIPKWGQGKFAAFYLKGLGLGLDNIAFANVAWCATKNNSRPASMLNRCFEKHTKVLLQLLAPHILLVSGYDAKKYCKEVERVLPQLQIVPMAHYAHRKGKKFTKTEIGRVREVLESSCWKDG